jgi:hypothetical protein
MAAPKDSRLRRSLRRFTLGSGSLKRGSDRVQVAGRVLVVLSVLLAPLVAVAAAGALTTHLQAVAAAEAADRSRTRAVLLENAPATTNLSVGDYPDTSIATVPVRAVWPLSRGGSREGLVLVRPRSPAGTAVPVWVGGDGNLTPAPLDRADIPISAVAVGALPLIGLPVTTWLLYALFLLALDRYRGRRWERDWAAVEPVWTSRLR